jgi:hypothetical protein
MFIMPLVTSSHILYQFAANKNTNKVAVQIFEVRAKTTSLIMQLLKILALLLPCPFYRMLNSNKARAEIFGAAHLKLFARLV